MSQIQPCFCAVETVYGVIALCAIVIRNLHRQRPIDEQHIAAIYERHIQRRTEQQGPESEQSMNRSALEATGLRGLHGVDVVSAFDDFGDLIDDVAYAEFADAMIAQERREPARVQMVGVVQQPRHIRGVVISLGASPDSHSAS